MTMSPTSSSDVGLVELFNSVIEQAVPAMHGLGIRVVELVPGRVVATAPLAGNANHMGTLYAGTLFGLGEMLGGALFAGGFDVERFYPTVKDVQIRFLRPARTDVRAEASLSDVDLNRLRLQAEQEGKAEFVLEASITDADGTVVATTIGTYQVRRHQS